MSARRTAQRQEGQAWEPEEAGLRTCQSRRLLPRPPALPSSPCCPAAESPRRREPMGAGGPGLGYQSPRGPAGRAHRLAPRLPRACAPRASVVAGGSGGARGQLGPRGAGLSSQAEVMAAPRRRRGALGPLPEGQRATAKPARTARGPPGSPATCDGLRWAAPAGTGAQERVCTHKLREVVRN